MARRPTRGRHRRSSPLLLYSTNTWLVYIISETYYRGEHYVWCIPYAGPGSLAAHDVTVPPSSSPLEIYRALHHEVERGERHSSRIQENKAGILRGANVKRRADVIDGATEAEMAAIVDAAETRDFRPLLYVVPFARVSNLVRAVPVPDRAHPLSTEYVIEALPRRC